VEDARNDRVGLVAESKQLGEGIVLCLISQKPGNYREEVDRESDSACLDHDSTQKVPRYISSLERSKYS